MISVLEIFLLSVSINFVLKFITPKLGSFRRGLDTVVYCSILSGYIGGPYTGALAGLAISITYYMFRSKQFSKIPIVVLVSFLTGIISGIINGLDLITVSIIMILFYHALSALLVGITKQIQAKYVLFVIINVITTIFLILLTQSYLL